MYDVRVQFSGHYPMHWTRVSDYEVGVAGELRLTLADGREYYYSPHGWANAMIEEISDE